MGNPATVGKDTEASPLPRISVGIVSCLLQPAPSHVLLFFKKKNIFDSIADRN